MVTNTIKDILKNKKGSKKNAYRGSIHRIIQQIRQSNIPGSSSERSTILSMRNFGLSISLANSTIQKYSKVNGAFQWFLLIHNIPRSDPYAIECFAAYLSVNKKGYDLNNLKPALQFFADVEGWKLNVPNSFARLKKGLLKAYYIVDRKKLKRNGVSAYDIRNYIDSVAYHDEFTFNLTTAILVIGFRLLARPGDLCNLSWSSIKVDYPKKDWITFDLSGHKTDFFMIDDPTPIEPLKKGQNNKYCPSFILKRYINMVKHFKSRDSPLFSWSDDLYLETTDLSNIIKNAMSFVGTEHVSGHSLRIGAATELASKGVSEVIIDTAGNWVNHSKSKKRYIRRVGLAATSLSTTLLQ